MLSVELLEDGESAENVLVTQQRRRKKTSRLRHPFRLVVVASIAITSL